GDPETQVILPRIVSDIVPLLIACAGGVLKGHTLEIAPDYCACVVLASQGYPGAYKKGFLIEGLENFSAHTNPLVFQAGTKEKNGQVFTAGGRVLGVTAWDINLKGTLEKVYEAVDKINFKGKHFRRDIGYRALKRF
ncbi:MAG: phosphoribosylglycinamide synthetase C domain-containing protein, partial [Dethiobacteria bacterium]